MLWGYCSWLLRPPNTHVNICTNLLEISPAFISVALNTAEHAYFLEIVSFHTLQDTILSWFSSICCRGSFSDSAWAHLLGSPSNCQCAERSILPSFPFSTYARKLGYLLWTRGFEYHMLSQSASSILLVPVTALNFNCLLDILTQKFRWGFPGGAVVENLPANAGDTGSSPGLGGSHMPRSN